MTLLTIENITVKYNYGATAVTDFCMSTENGVTVVLGGSESGKTSLFKGIAGLAPTVGGKIEINGKDITDAKTKARNVCLIYEDGCFFERRSVFYNIEYPLMIRKIDKQKRKEMVEEAAEVTGLSGYLGFTARKLPPKERVLLSLARVYHRQADLFLFDDPLKALGEKREELFPFLKSFMEEKAKGRVVLYGTSSGKECFSVGKECILLNYGITVQSGTAEGIAQKPRSAEAVRLLNPEVTLYDGKIIGDGGKLYVAFENSEYPLNEKFLLSDIFIGKECIVAEGGKRLFDKRSERVIYYER